MLSRQKHFDFQKIRHFGWVDVFVDLNVPEVCFNSSQIYILFYVLKKERRWKKMLKKNNN